MAVGERGLAVTRTLMGFLSGRCVRYSNRRAGFISNVFKVFNRNYIININRTLRRNNRGLGFCRNGGRRGVTLTTITCTGRVSEGTVVPYISSVKPKTAGVIATYNYTATGEVPLLILPNSAFTYHRPSPILRRTRFFSGFNEAIASTFGNIYRCFSEVLHPRRLVATYLGTVHILASPTSANTIYLTVPRSIRNRTCRCPRRFLGGHI